MITDFLCGRLVLRRIRIKHRRTTGKKESKLIAMMPKHPLTSALADAEGYRGRIRSLRSIFSSLPEGWDRVLMNFMVVFTVMMILSACSSGGSGGDSGGGSVDLGYDGGNIAPTYTIGGIISGLTGTVVLQNKDMDLSTIISNGTATVPFTFSTTLIAGATYAVTVKTQPAGQTCSIVRGIGIIPGANVYTVKVTCSEFTHTVSGIVSGLAGTVVLQNNDVDLSTIVSSGTDTVPFTFIALADGTSYDVMIREDPSRQACTIANGSGTLSGADITGVTVTCQDALAWDAPVSLAVGSITTDVAGYKIYYGTESGVYTGSIDVGNTTRYPIADFSGAVTVKNIMYYITVTSYDADKTTESAYSNEIYRIIN
jgi:hypothetical protein